MEFRQLGRTSLTVSRLCFGALTVGPLQARLPLQEGVAVIRAALEAGVNFIDTAELYGTYDYIRQAIAGFSKTIVASKSYAWTYDGMRDSVEQACRGIDRDYIDIFMLHEQTSRLTLKGHREALDYLVRAKQQGLVRAIGVSTHMVEVVQAAALLDEVDVIHPILNQAGIGIMDGTVDDMIKATQFAVSQGKGLYTMKALGGGHLSRISHEAMQWILAQEHITSVAIGMQSLEEVAFNTAIFEGQRVEADLQEKVVRRKRTLLIEDWCAGCGSCVRKCPMHALYMAHKKVAVDPERCVLCGYCGAHCPEFALKIV